MTAIFNNNINNNNILIRINAINNTFSDRVFESSDSDNELRSCCQFSLNKVRKLVTH